jgi:hypothetical protein
MSKSKRPPNLYEVRRMNRRLAEMNVKLGGATAEVQEDRYAVPEEVLRNMNRFEQDEVKLAMALRLFRDTMQEETDLAKGKDPDTQLKNPRLARVRQSLRKQEMELKPMQRALTSSASSDDEKRRCREALHHLSTMRKRYEAHRDAFQHAAFGTSPTGPPGGGGGGSGVGVGDDDYEARLYPGAAGGGVQAPLLNNLDELEMNKQNLREDAEFVMFFEQIAQQDQRIDQALDRIYAGTVQLKENAMRINQELKTQEVILEEVQTKTEKTTEKLTTLNKRVKKAVKDLSADRMCMYIICCIVLLALVGFILYETKVIKN